MNIIILRNVIAKLREKRVLMGDDICPSEYGIYEEFEVMGYVKLTKGLLENEKYLCVAATKLFREEYGE